MNERLTFLPGQIAPNLEDIIWEFVTDVRSKGKYPLKDLSAMLKADPISGAAVTVKSARAIALTGSFKHSNENVARFPSGEYTPTEFINSCWESMEGSLTDTILKMAKQAYGLGRSVAEIVFSTDLGDYKGELRIKRINILEPSRIKFAGKKGEIDRVIYNSSKGEVAIPYAKCIHVFNAPIDSNDPNGEPQAACAYPYWEAHKLLMREWAIATQRQATGLTIVQAPSEDAIPEMNEKGEVIKDENGSIKYTSALAQALKQLQGLSNGSIVGTDRKNSIVTVPQTGGEGFFNLTSEKLDKYRWLAFGIPWTIFNEGTATLGQAGLNFGHRLILDTQIEEIARQMRDRLINNIVRPLLIWNFGIKDDFGSFESEQFLDPGQAGMRVSNLMTCIQTGVFNQNDLEALNQLRKDLGLSLKKQSVFNEELIAKLMAAQQQQQQQQAEQQKAEEGGGQANENPYL